MSRSNGLWMLALISFCATAPSASAQRARAHSSTSAEGRVSAAPSANTYRRLTGILAGAAIGGGLGYLVANGACGRCDTPRPISYGAAIGAVGGAMIGASFARADALDAGGLPIRTGSNARRRTLLGVRLSF